MRMQSAEERGLGLGLIDWAIRHRCEGVFHGMWGYIRKWGGQKMRERLSA